MPAAVVLKFWHSVVADLVVPANPTHPSFSHSGVQRSPKRALGVHAVIEVKYRLNRHPVVRRVALIAHHPKPVSQRGSFLVVGFPSRRGAVAEAADIRQIGRVIAQYLQVVNVRSGPSRRQEDAQRDWQPEETSGRRRHGMLLGLLFIGEGRSAVRLGQTHNNRGPVRRRESRP